MKINNYSFGKIVIEGKEYTSDVIVYTDHVDASWWRKEGHYLQAGDLTNIIDAKPDVLVIGTGFWGVMAVPEETTKFVSAKGIEIKVARTANAIELFNGIGEDIKAIAALHLTC